MDIFKDREEAVLKIFGNYRGLHLHGSAKLQKLYSTTGIYLECFDNSQTNFVNHLQETASALVERSWRGIVQCNSAEVPSN